LFTYRSSVHVNIAHVVIFEMINDYANSLQAYYNLGLTLNTFVSFIKLINY